MNKPYNSRDWMSHPAYLHAPYKSTILHSPTKPLIPIKQSLSERTGPVYGHEKVGVLDSDLTKNGAHNGEPLGERIIVTGRVLDEDGRPVRNTLVEVWQPMRPGATSTRSTSTTPRSIRTSSAAGAA